MQRIDVREEENYQVVEPYNRLSQDSFYVKTPLHVTDVPIYEGVPIMEEEDNLKKAEDKEIADVVDQITIETVNEHIKKISQLPKGLKDQVETDLIQKVTTSKPEHEGNLQYFIQRNEE